MTPPICVVGKITKPPLSCWNPKTSWVFWYCICYSSPKNSQEFSHTHTHTHLAETRHNLTHNQDLAVRAVRCFHIHSFTAIVLIHSVHKQRPSGFSQSGSFKGHDPPKRKPNYHKLSLFFGSMAKHITFDWTFHFYHFPRPIAGSGRFWWGWLVAKAQSIQLCRPKRPCLGCCSVDNCSVDGPIRSVYIHFKHSRMIFLCHNNG